MKDHRHRRSSVSEMHLRRWPVLPVPCHILQWVIAVDDTARKTELRAIEEVADDLASVENPSHREGSLGDHARMVWERHSEGSSVTIFLSDCDESGYLDPQSDQAAVDAIAWANGLPGTIIRATRIWLGASEAEIEPIVGRSKLNEDELVSTMLGGGMRIWSDFRIHADGFGRLIVAANGTDPHNLTRQLQRLQELGNYRNKALLGLPLAREFWTHIDESELRLRNLAHQVANNEEHDDAILAKLSALALDIASVSTAISFRMDATRAYARIVEERLAQLVCSPIPGFASLTDFTQRRFRPAMDTCAATAERVRRLGIRVEQISSLLRARIETRIERQNTQMLQSMERSISLQLRLQQLVEGLSVVALTYYSIGLLSYFLGGIRLQGIGLAKDSLLSLSVPIALAAVWLIIRLRKKWLLEGRNCEVA